MWTVGQAPDGATAPRDLKVSAQLSDDRRRLASVARASRVAVLTLVAGIAGEASAHDVRLPLADLEQGTQRVRRTLDYLRASPALPPPPRTAAEHRRILGAAEIELALHNEGRALQMLVARIADPSFHDVPEFVDTLLLASELLEKRDEVAGAMGYARQALVRGGGPEQMAEAGARWFRLARRHQRLAGRLEIYELWRARGGAQAATEEVRSGAAYEAAFALRAARRFDEAQALLTTVPSGSLLGSRAAYLAGVMFVESGDLANAERWFTAIKDWPIPVHLTETETQKATEIDVRELSTLSAARLRYERGDLEGADEAYTSISEGSAYLDDACYERAFLNLERKRRRGAMNNLQCVIDLGAGGDRYVDVALMRASLYAHLGKYGDSVDHYTRVGLKLSREGDVMNRAVASIENPAQFMFESMERNALTLGRAATPGPPLLFGDAWTPTLDTGYRVDRESAQSKREVNGLKQDLVDLESHLDKPQPFPAIEMRRRHYQILLRDIQHLQGHAMDVAMTLRHRHAATDAFAAATDHTADAARSQQLQDELGRYARFVEAELEEVDRQERDRIALADRVLGEMHTELEGLLAELRGIEAEAAVVTAAAARAALQQIIDRMRHGEMRAKVGILDTFWVRKEHVSQQIRNLGTQKQTMNDLFEAAEAELATELDVESE